MADTILNSVNPITSKLSQDGLICDVSTGDLGNADTSYSYFLLGAAGYDLFALAYLITATTLTFEATNDPLDLDNMADEFITAANDRTFSGAGNWVADGEDAAIAVNAGVLEVTAGVALSGAKLDKEFFDQGRGFRHPKKYTVAFTISALSAGTVSAYAGQQLIASGLTDGAQSIEFQTRSPGAKLSIVASDAEATFSLDGVSIKPKAAVWNDVTTTLSGGGASSLTSSGSATIMNPFPWARMRVKRVTTNATNALELRLARMKSC